MVFHGQIYLVQRIFRNYLSFTLSTYLLQAEVEGRCNKTGGLPYFVREFTECLDEICQRICMGEI